MSGALIPVYELPAIAWTEATRRRRTLVVMFAVTALLGLAAGLFWPKKYVASTSVLVQESNIIKPLMEGRAVATTNADRASIHRIFGSSSRTMSALPIAALKTRAPAR